VSPNAKGKMSLDEIHNSSKIRKPTSCGAYNQRALRGAIE